MEKPAKPAPFNKKVTTEEIEFINTLVINSALWRKVINYRILQEKIEQSFRIKLSKSTLCKICKNILDFKVIRCKLSGPI